MRLVHRQFYAVELELMGVACVDDDQFVYANGEFVTDESPLVTPPSEAFVQVWTDTRWLVNGFVSPSSSPLPRTSATRS